MMGWQVKGYMENIWKIYGPKLHSPFGSCNFTEAHKTRDSQRQSSLLLPQIMYLPASKTLRTGPYKS